jgi:hypothetical protein
MYTLIISSLYANSLTDQEMLNEEVQTDSKTVKELFDEWFELIVPAGPLSWKEFTDQKTELRKLMLKLKNVGETEVNIVLNTHGVPGKYDIDVSLIVELVQQLSTESIKINTIYALMCDGFTKRKATDGLPYKTNLSSLETPLKPSSMVILRSKLNNLETKIEQLFAIKGFAYPYTPNQAKKLIINFLLDEDVGETIYAHTTKQKEEDFNYLLECIALCRQGVNVQDPVYTKASNALGTLLHQINRHIDEYLKGFDEQLYAGSIPLFTEVLSSTKWNTDKITPAQFGHQYKRWVKECKLTSTTRLDILEAYCLYEKQRQDKQILLPARTDRVTFFAGKTELNDEPLSDIDIGNHKLSKV